MRSPIFVVALAALIFCTGRASAIDPYAGNDPFWVLLHEPAIIAELKLTQEQKTAYRKLLDEQDARFFPLRNQGEVDAEAGMKAINQHVQQQLKSLLQPDQASRLNQIFLQHLGNTAFLRDDMQTQLRLSDTQRKRIKDIADETNAAVRTLTTTQKEGSQSESTSKRYLELKTDEQKRMLAVMKPDQITILKKQFGPPFPLNELRKPAFKVPELIDSGEWINSKPLELSQLKGQVIVVHFYACGCINCIHNYPWYRQWQDQYRGRDVVLIGIHTPETASERDIATVRRKATEEKLTFPILIDEKLENWNAWGNSMWPAVYLIDKRGYLRDFWAGELKWQGTDGEKYMRARIEELRAEREDAAN